MPRQPNYLKYRRDRSSVRVLVVDDFSPVANALMTILATNFYDVQAAYSAVEALHIAEQFRPHVLIADVTLPGMDGFQLAAQFDIRYPDCRVLLTSAGYFRGPQDGRGLRVVQKASVVEEAFQLLDDCRGSEAATANGHALSQKSIRPPCPASEKRWPS